MVDGNESDRPIDVLLSTVQALFPDGAVELRHGGRGRSAQSLGDGSVELAVVPDAARARLLIPAGHRAPSRALARYSSALGARETLERAAVGVATRAVGTRLLPDAITVERSGSDDVLGLLADVLGHPVAISLGVGTARANRKPVLGVLDQRGRLVAYAKVGDTPVAREHVRGEAAALRRIAAPSWRSITVPSLLAEREWNGMLVVVMSALDTAPMRPARHPALAPEQAMSEIVRAFDEGWMELADTPLVHRMLARAATMSASDTTRTLTAALEQLLERHGDQRVRVGGWHGDFAPWNVARRRGRLAVWDWERFGTGVPEGLDRVHWAVNVRTRERGFQVDTVRDAVAESRRTAPAGPGRTALPGEVHLAALACRYLAAAEGPGGAAIASNAVVVLEALVAEIGRTAPGTGPRGASCRNSAD